MVISERLVWVHIPKTAGDATLAMFRRLDVDWRLIHGHKDPEKHRRLPELLNEDPDCRHLAVIANLRRLPEVALSYFHHMQRHDPTSQVGRSGVRFGEIDFHAYLAFVLENPDTQTYDWILDHYLGPEDPDHWLDVSRLAESFVKVISPLHPIPEPTRLALREIRENAGDYERAWERWFRPGEMGRLYENCPRWRGIEERELGGTLAQVLGWTPTA